MSEFLTQGGYGFFVWGSYITTLLVLAVEVATLLKRKKHRGMGVSPMHASTGGTPVPTKK